AITNLRGYVPALLIPPDGKRVLAWVSPNEVRVYDQTGNALRQFAGHDRDVNCLAFSADGELVALGEKDGGEVRICEGMKGERPGGDLPAHQDPVGDLIFVPGKDKKLLITASRKGEVKVWDLEKRQQPLRAFQGHEGAVTAFAVTADGRRFATTGE